MTGDRPSLISRLLSPAGMAVLGIAAVALYYGVTEHSTHLYQVLPFGFLLLCPLLHLFMMRGHGHGSAHDHGQSNGQDHMGHHDAQIPAPSPKAVGRAEER